MRLMAGDDFMHISLLLMNQIIQLFIMIFMGFIIVKTKLLKAEDNKILSVIVLYLIILNPQLVRMGD